MIFLLLPQVLLTQHCFSSFFDIADRSSSDRSSSIQSISVLRSIDQIEAPTFFVLPLFFVLCQIVDAAHCSSSNRSSIVPLQFSVLRQIILWFFRYQNRVLETRFCFLELESIRLEIYLAKTDQIS